MIRIGLDIAGIANSVLISLLEILKVFSGQVMVFDREVYSVPMKHSLVHKLSTKYGGSRIEPVCAERHTSRHFGSIRFRRDCKSR